MDQTFLYRRPNLPPWSPRLAPWFSVRCVSHFFNYEYPDVPLYLTGLSWLIGSSLHDILTSIIFLFIRHPFDVGDKVDLGAPNGTFTVKEIRLLSTILLNGNGTYVQVSNNVLSTLVRLCNFMQYKLVAQGIL